MRYRITEHCFDEKRLTFDPFCGRRKLHEHDYNLSLLDTVEAKGCVADADMNRRATTQLLRILPSS